MNSTNRIRVLFLAANPKDEGQLDIYKEIREIQEKIRAGEHRDTLELFPCLAARPGDLIQRFSEVRPHVVHFSGHGDRINRIYLENDDGKSHPVSEVALERLFQVMKENIRLVLLNACFAGSQAKVIAKNIEATIGMKVAVGDVAAIHFSAAFYRAITFGKSVFQAFEEARLELMLQGIPEEHTPQLFTRADMDVKGLFLLEPACSYESDEVPVFSQPEEMKTGILLWRSFSLKLVQRLEAGRHLVVWTSKYSGKTEFIRFFTKFLKQKRPKWRVVNLRPLTIPNISEAEYFEELIGQLSDRELGHSISNEGENGAGHKLQFYRSLKNLIRKSGDRLVLILNSMEKSNIDHLKVIVSGLKQIHDEMDGESFNLIFIGGEELHELCFRHISPDLSPLNFTKTDYLPDLSPRETAALLKANLPDLTDKAVSKTYDLTCGYFSLVRHCVERCEEDGRVSEYLAEKMEREARFFGEIRILIGTDAECRRELSRWLLELPEYNRELSNIRNPKLFWLGLLRVEDGAFAWRCPLVRGVVEKMIGQILQ
jgi:hypothetical protein